MTQFMYFIQLYIPVYNIIYVIHLCFYFLVAIWLSTFPGVRGGMNVLPTPKDALHHSIT